MGTTIFFSVITMKKLKLIEVTKTAYIHTLNGKLTFKKGNLYGIKEIKEIKK